ncbi:MAG: DUF4396 domain-containing protein [Acidobacteriota bacterium]
MANVPQWLEFAAWTWIAICVFCSLVILAGIIREPQKMAIMNIVWPVTALYMGPAALPMFYRAQPLSSKGPMSTKMKQAIERHKDDPPTFFQNSLAVFHCGAGCTLGDIIAESLAGSLMLTFAGEFGSKLILDFVFAYAIGIVFQYFTIAPMRGLSFGKGLVAAVRADTISITLFQAGMYAWMALSYFVFFPRPHLNPGMAVFWFMMQIAMVVGFFTALPANAWLIRKGWKEKMPQVSPEQIESDGREEPPKELPRAA